MQSRLSGRHRGVVARRRHERHLRVTNGAVPAGRVRHISTMADTSDAGRREYYPIRAVDLLAIGMFWLFLAFLSAAGRELDPRIPDLPARVVSGVLNATYV